MMPTSSKIKKGRYIMKNWIKKAGVRAIKTVAQAAIAMIGTAAVMQDVDWKMVTSAAVLAGVLSLLTSIAGLPELKIEGAGESTLIVDDADELITADEKEGQALKTIGNQKKK